MSAGHQKVAILLATLNGARFLEEQLQSYRSQTYPNWELWVSDDGSVDRTVEIIRAFATSIPQRVTVAPGMRLGYWQNFMSMVRSSDIEGEFFAVLGADALATVAAIVGAESAAKTVFAHDGNQIALVKQAF